MSDRTAKLGEGEKDVRKIVSALNRMVEGRLDCYGQVTLRAGETTTTVDAYFASPNSTIVLSPRTANAAAAMASTFVSAKGNRAFTLAHANNAQTDRIFDYAFIG